MPHPARQIGRHADFARTASQTKEKPPKGGFLADMTIAQAEKLEPQPQVVVAFGFLITN